MAKLEFEAGNHVNDLFTVKNKGIGGIVWSKDSSRIDDSYHNPALVALRRGRGTNHSGINLQKKEQQLKLLEEKSGYPLIRTEKAAILENLDTSPATAIQILLSDTPVKKEGLLTSTTNKTPEEEQQILRNKLKEAKKYLICGIMDTPGFLNLLDNLYTLGFQGELWVMDISDRILDEINVDWNNEWSKKYPGINLNLLQADLTAIDIDNKAETITQRNSSPELDAKITTIPKGYFDWMQMDVLGYYLSPKNWDVDIPILGEVLKPDGVAIICDMEEYEELDTKEKFTAKVPTDIYKKDAAWAQQTLNWDITPEEAELIWSKAFSTTPEHIKKQFGEDKEYWYQNVLNKFCHLSAVVTPQKYWESEYPTRLFRYIALRSVEHH